MALRDLKTSKLQMGEKLSLEETNWLFKIHQFVHSSSDFLVSACFGPRTKIGTGSTEKIRANSQREDHNLHADGCINAK